MHNLFTEFGLFLWAVAQQYVTLAAGCAVTVMIDLLAKYWLKRPLSYREDVAILGGFVFLACFLAWRSEYENTKPPIAQPIQVNVPSQAPPQVNVNVPASTVNIPPEEAYFGPDGAPSLGSYFFGKYVAVTSSSKNFSPSVPAEDAMVWARAFPVDTTLTSQDQPIVTLLVQDQKFAEFEKSLPSLRKGQRTTVGPGESNFGTASPGILDEKLDNEFRNATKTILFASEYNWRDRGGWHTNQFCAWLQLGPEMPAIFSGPGSMIPHAAITWNRCNNHNGLVRH